MVALAYARIGGVSPFSSIHLDQISIIEISSLPSFTGYKRQLQTALGDRSRYERFPEIGIPRRRPATTATPGHCERRDRATGPRPRLLKHKFDGLVSVIKEM